MTANDARRLSPDEPRPSPDVPGRHEESILGQPAKPIPEPPAIRWRRVLLVVLPVAALAVALLALILLVDTDALLDDLSRAALAPARGQVLYQGQPLRDGVIMTQPLGSRGRPALGWTDEEGMFSLKTDIRGELVEGATVGEHRVAVTAYQNVSVGPGALPLATPEKYASPTTTPLRITIGRDPEQNQFQLILEGEPPPRPKRRTGGDQKAAPPSAGRFVREAGTSSEENAAYPMVEADAAEDAPTARPADQP